MCYRMESRQALLFFVPGLLHVLPYGVEAGPPHFVPGSPHVIPIESRQDLLISYQAHHMFLSQVGPRHAALRFLARAGFPERHGESSFSLRARALPAPPCEEAVRNG